MFRSLTALVLLTAAGLAAGCGDDELPTTPTNPTAITETFSGTLNPNSARNHDFVAQSAGSVTAQLVTITPDSTDNPTTFGLALGTWTGTACQVVVDRNVVGLNGTLTGNATSAGTLCVRIYDSSEFGFATPVDYSITVLHY